MLERAGVPFGPVYSIRDIARDPQFLARDMIVEFTDHRLGPITMPGVVPTLSDTPGSIAHAGPALGADTERVLRDVAGLSDAEIAALRAEGAI